MLRKSLGGFVRRSWFRVALAALLLVAGLLPVSIPILSDDTLRQALNADASAAPEAGPLYRWHSKENGVSSIERSQDDGRTWRIVSSVPDDVLQVEARSANARVVFARGATNLWRSENGGANWAVTSLGVRPLSMAISPAVPGLVLVGTESMGLYRSADNGLTWHQLGQGLGLDGAGAVGVTAVALHPENGRLVYAASGYWLGTSQARFSPVGVFISADYGQNWFQMVAGRGGEAPGAVITALQPDLDQALAVAADTEQGRVAYELPVTPALAEGLDSSDPAVRASVAHILGLSRAQSMMPTLLAHIDDPDLLAGDQVAEALGRLGNPAAVPTLTQALTHPAEPVRARAAYALGLLKSQESVGALASMLHNDGPLARSRAAEALAQIGDSAAIDALIMPLADAELTPGRQAAMRGLELAGRPAVSQLARSLHSPNAAMRRNAAEMLGWIGAAPATEDLVRALSDADPAVRSQAAWALGQAGTTQAREALAAAVASEQDEAVRRSAEQALAEVEARPAVDMSFGAALARTLGQVPVSRWTFLALVMVLAALLLAGNPQRLNPQRS